MRTFFFLVAIAVVSASCMRAEVVVDVSDNGSGTVDAIVGVESERAAQFEILIGDLCGAMVEEAIQDVAIERYEADGRCGIRGTGNFAHESQLEFEAKRALGPAADFLANPVSLVRTDTGWSFSYDFTPVDEARGVDADDGGDLATDLLGVNEAELLVKIRMPGTVVSHNGTVDDDNFVTWTIEPFGDPRTLSAETDTSEGAEPADDDAASAAAAIDGGGDVAADDDDGGSNTVVILAVVAAIAVAALVVVGMLRRRGAPS